MEESSSNSDKDNMESANNVEGGTNHTDSTKACSNHSAVDIGCEGKNATEDMEVVENNHCAVKTDVDSTDSCDTKSTTSPDGAINNVSKETEAQNDSALCVSPKSDFSAMDISCDKDAHFEDCSNESKSEHLDSERKDDSGICFEKNESENNVSDMSDTAKVTQDENHSVNLPTEKETVDHDDDVMCSVGGAKDKEKDKKHVALVDYDDSDDLSEKDEVMQSTSQDKAACDNGSQEDTRKQRKKKASALDSDDDSDSSNGATGYDVTSAKKTSDKEKDSSASDNSDLEHEMDALDVFLARRKRQLDSDHSSQSSQQGDEESTSRMDGENDTKSESDEDEPQLDLDFTPPKDSWNPLVETRAREMGFGNKTYGSHKFRTKCGSSVMLVQRFERKTTLDNHDGCVNALHFNKSGSLLASGSDDLNIVVWDWVKGKPYFTFESGHRSNVFQCKFMPYTGDSHIVSCARDGQVRLAELSSAGRCKGTKKLAQHKGAAHKLALLEDSSHVFYSCGEDAVVYEVDLRQEKPNKLFTTKEKDRKIPLYSIHSNPFKSYEYCVGGRDHFLRVYDKRMMEGDGSKDNVLKKFCPHHLVSSDIKANVTCAVYNWNGMEVLGTYNDEDIYMFDNTHSDGAEFIKKYKGHRNNATVKGVNFYGPRSEFVVSGSDCGNVFLWEKESTKIVNYFHADEGGVVNVLEPHPHMPVLATSGLDHDVKIWTPTAKEPTKLDGLAKLVKKNHRERKDERVNEPDMLDGRMLWFLMHHLRRVRRGERADNDGSSTDSDDVERGESEQSEDDEPMQCMPS